MRVAARLIGGTAKFGHVSADYMRDVLHWLPLPPPICYRISAVVWRILLGMVPVYLQELCRSTLGLHGRRSLHPAAHGELLVPFARTSIMQRRTFFRPSNCLE